MTILTESVTTVDISPKIIEILCDSMDGVAVDDLYYMTFTPLHVAVYYGASVQIMETLLR